MKKNLLIIALFPVLLSLSACQGGEKKVEFQFKLWNDCEAITRLKDFVKKATDKNSDGFVPVKDRIATFDMDGTIYGELYPTYLEYNMLVYRALEDESYDAPQDVIDAATAIKEHVEEGKAYPDKFELIHANAAAKAYAGMSVKEFDTYVKNYLKTPAWGFENMTYGEGFYKPMLEIFDYLEENEFTYYIVSGSDRAICRSLICDTLDIQPSQIIGMDVEYKAKNQGETDGLDYVFDPKTDDVIRTEHLLIKNLKMNKIKQINQDIGKQPILSFGNSGGDCSMHNYALANPTYNSAAFMLIANDEERDYGNTVKTEELGKTWKQNGYTVISMKDDFKTIYGENVVKKASN